MRSSIAASLWCGVLVVPQVPQHFRFSKTQATGGDGCFARQSVCSVVPVFAPACPGQYIGNRCLRLKVDVQN